MGKAHGRNKKFAKNKNKPRKDNNTWRDDKTSFKDSLSNANFEAYYKSQDIVPEEEWESFMEAFRTPLPTTFRITGTRLQAMEILDSIENRFVPNLTGLKIDDQEIEAPQPIPWYPNKFGWGISAPRAIVKKSPEFSKFQKFLVSESEVGNISRQEAVSMVPPLMLDVQPQHWVIDMCAAPGSKTAQLIEALHNEDEISDSKLKVPEGLIVANDAEEKRCYTLVHQIKRLKSPNFVVTHHEAQFFPNVRLNATESSESQNLRFDRVLCDVPCSGDGTLRKNYKIWDDWHVGQGLSLHILQASILARGAQLSKVGGRLVYSTCSLNPVENEAVVASVLNRYPGKLVLKDVSTLLPELKRRPGMNSWKVFIKNNQEVKTFEELSPEDKAKKWAVSTLFPPSNAESLGLEKCVRIYPHLQNTGGFFVAVFEKIDSISTSEIKENATISLPTTSEIKETLAAPALDANGLEVSVDSSVPESQEGTLKRATDSDKENFPSKRPRSKEDPFVFLDASSTELQNIKEHFILNDFPTSQLLVRSETDKNKTVSFVSESVVQLLSGKNSDRIKLVNTGVKAFQRIDNSRKLDCSFRLQNESLSLLVPFLPESLVIHVTPYDMKVLLEQNTPFIRDLTTGVQEKLTPLEQGTVVIKFCLSAFTGSEASATPVDDDATKPQPKVLLSSKVASQLVFPLWKAQVSVNLLLNKEEQSSLHLRLFGEL